MNKINFGGMVFRVINGYFKRGKIYLHRLIWEANKGPIPKGFSIHHKDGNKLNNSIDNLECLPHAEHRRFHMKEIGERLHKWHKSAAGRKSLGEKASKLMQNRPFQDFTCPECSRVFESQNIHRVKYCSISCQQKARRKRGDDLVERICEICEKPFKINKYQKTRTCGYECGDKLRRLNTEKPYWTVCEECEIQFFCKRPTHARFCSGRCRQRFWLREKRSSP